MMTTTTYAVGYHESPDSQHTKIERRGLSIDEALAWLRAKAEQCRQPVLPDMLVNESDEDGCGYFFASVEE